MAITIAGATGLGDNIAICQCHEAHDRTQEKTLRRTKVDKDGVRGQIDVNTHAADKTRASRRIRVDMLAAPLLNGSISNFAVPQDERTKQ